MCTIAFLVGVTDAPLVLVANRDELYARAARPPDVLSPGVVGGVDVVSGGTWLALARDGRFAAVTNHRAMAPPLANVRSRGPLVRALVEARDPDAFVAALDPRAYAGMNLAWGTADRVALAYLRHDAGTRDVEVLPRGIHVLCNDRVDAPGYPRGARLQRALEAAVGGAERRESLPSFDALVPALTAALADHTRAPAEDVGPSHLPPAIAHAVTATCIHTDVYGTRSSTIAALDRGAVRRYLASDGPPCSSPMLDRTGLLA